MHRSDKLESKFGQLSVLRYAEEVQKYKKANPKNTFGKDHPQKTTHDKCRKRKRRLVAFIGPRKMASKIKRENPDEYAKAVLTMFKP